MPALIQFRSSQLQPNSRLQQIGFQCQRNFLGSEVVLGKLRGLAFENPRILNDPLEYNHAIRLVGADFEFRFGNLSLRRSHLGLACAALPALLVNQVHYFPQCGEPFLLQFTDREGVGPRMRLSGEPSGK